MKIEQIMGTDNKSQIDKLKRLNQLARQERRDFQEVPTPSDYSKSSLGTLLLGYLAIKDRGMALGYVLFSYGEKYGNIPIFQQLFVKKRYRQQGIATALVKIVTQNHATKLNSHGHYFILDHPNVPSIKLFQKLGFVEEKDGNYRLLSCGRFGETVISN